MARVGSVCLTFSQPRLPAGRLTQHEGAADTEDDGLRMTEDGRDLVTTCSRRQRRQRVLIVSINGLL